MDKLRVNLEHDLLTVTGLPIKLWQDVDEIKWGQEWKKAIDKGLTDAAFFIPVITPGYLFSDVCRIEFTRFAEFEKKRGRTDLILPLIYVMPEDFDDEEAKKKDLIVRLCFERQYVNWEDLRGLGDEGQEYRTRLTALSKRIRQLLKSLPNPSVATTTKNKRSPGTKKRMPPRRRKDAASQSSAPTKVSHGEVAKGNIVAPVQRTLYVNRLGHPGTFQGIAAALEAAQGGDRILVAPGHYSEAIVLTKPVVIVGEGNLSEVTVSVKDANVVQSTIRFGRLQNLVLHQNGGGKFFGVNVEAGSLEIDTCEVTSASISCIGVQKGAEVRVRRCKVHGSPQCGITFFSGSKGVVEECEIYDNGFPGIWLEGSGDVTIRSNKIHNGRSAGVRIGNDGRGLIEDNDIFANAFGGIMILECSDPTVRRNRIHDGRTGGVVVLEQGKGSIAENDIFRNAFTGIEVRDGSTPSISDNDVHENTGSGLFVHTDGGGLFENNRIRKNGNNGAVVQEGARPQFRKNRFLENQKFGIRVGAEGGGVFEGNEFSDNKAGHKHIDPRAETNVQWKDEGI